MGAPGIQAPGRLLPPLLLLLAALGLAVPCVPGGLPKPTNITFLSINMKNVLHWNPPEGLHGVEVTYTVEYFIYGQNKWLSASECRSISRTYCDLSAETSDYNHQYYAKVKANQETKCSEWAEIGRFYPLSETQVGPPEVALTTGEKSISIALTAPEKWKRNPEDDTISMQQIYTNLKYNVSVYNAKSGRTWSECITTSTLVLNWLEPSTLYCVQVESVVPGLSRLALPSQKQCISTLEDQASARKIKVLFWYVLPTSVIIFLFSVIGYSAYRYIHIGKEKYPSNLILIYGNEIKRFFEPTETIMLNFITFNMLDDSKISQKDMSLLEDSSYGSSLDDLELSGSWEPHLEEEQGQHLGYSSDLMDMACGANQSDRNACLTQDERLNSTMPTGEADADPKNSVPTDFYREVQDYQFYEQQEAPRTGEPWATLENLDLPLEDLYQLGQMHPGSEEGPEEGSPTTLVDWDPQTGRLCIPFFPSFGRDPGGYRHYERDCLSGDGLSSRPYENQIPDKPEDENENYLMQFMEDQGLVTYTNGKLIPDFLLTDFSSDRACACQQIDKPSQ